MKRRESWNMKMGSQHEKVYVAIGTDLYDGFSTLQWTLKRWSKKEINIVILHAGNSICKDYVYTPLGKLPASSVSEEKLKLLEKTEAAKSDKILSRYISFCGGVKAEIQKIERNEQPMDKKMVELISSLHITKLVMSFTFMKSSSWKSRSAISGSFYVHRQKPDFCEVFVINGGRLIYLKEENDEGLMMEDDRGYMIAKLKDQRSRSIRNWLGKMFPADSNNQYNHNNNISLDSPSSSSSSNSNYNNNNNNYISSKQWEKCCEEIEQYVNQLVSLQEEEGEMNVGNASFKDLSNSTRIDMPEDMDATERIQVLKQRIQIAQEAIQLNRKKANEAKERRGKAEWAITMCNARAGELESYINEVVMKNVELKKEQDYRKEELNELQIEVDEKRNKLNTVLELQKELSGKLQLSSSAKTRSEIQLEKAVRTRADMVLEIEELRKQRDVLKRRIEFCKEKDAIGKVSKLKGLSFDFREFTAAEIRTATKDFSEGMRLKCGGQWTNVCKARLCHITVAIKVYSPENAESHEVFMHKVKLLSKVQHQNLLTMIGFCSELNCIVYEYMHNGTLKDALSSIEKSCLRKNRPLSWHSRIRIAANICAALGFLHKARPTPIVHGNLSPLKVLLDRNNVAKLNGFTKNHSSYNKNNVRVDIRAFGNILLQLLTGKNDIEVDFATVIGGLDHLAGQWPLDLAVELCNIGIRCSSDEQGLAEEVPMREINDVRRRADELVSSGEFPMPIDQEIINVEDLSNVPSAFLCPIYQDIMQNPHLAADGFSYEMEAIDEWLKTGHDTSPMTNLKLQHKILTPNHTLRSLIQEWQNKTSATLPLRNPFGP